MPGPHDRAHPGFAEDQLGPLVGVLGVHRHIGRAGRQYGEDGDVQVVGAYALLTVLDIVFGVRSNTFLVLVTLLLFVVAT
ncbi:hypothetical protein, partial [Streptomyces sp. NPDC006333]|uniref:hypothetical protein n=1 Tax=Streptomyces sp. NPDC006333 TaxID=3156753 RepID=UPI0033B271B6